MNMSQYGRLRQIALYLLCWREAAQVRFLPKYLCFIFKCTDDYYRSPNRIDPVPKDSTSARLSNHNYHFIRDQGYESVVGKFIRPERDHDRIIGYDDVNQLFWYSEDIAHIVLTDKARLVDIPPALFTCVSTASTGTAHSSRCIPRSLQCSGHIPAETRPLVCFDMVHNTDNSTWGCGYNCHYN